MGWANALHWCQRLHGHVQVVTGNSDTDRVQDKTMAPTVAHGACTVHLNGEAVKSCSVLTVACDGMQVETIEALKAHPLQAAMIKHQGLQCGFCTPGVIMAALDLIKRHGSSLTRETIATGLSGNICRCTGYRGMIEAIFEVSRDV